MLDFCIYLLFRAGSAVIARLPLRLVFRIGRMLGACAWALLGKYRRLAQHNVEIAFGETKQPDEIHRIVRQHFRQLGANLLSSVKLNAMPLADVAALIRVDGLDEVEAVLKSKRGVVLALSHLGNWELFAQAMPHFLSGARLSTVYQKLGNRFIDQHVREQRARSGVTLFDRSEGFQKAIELLRDGGLIGILSDQHAGDQGQWTPFFGRLASTSPLPALLCKRTGAALFAAGLYTDGVGRWRMSVTAQIVAKAESIQSLTSKTNQIIEEQIAHAPEDWFWVHNRWKTPRPNFLLAEYKRGVHVPPGTALKPFRILIRSSNWLGDCIISMPAVRAIKAGRPDAQITILAPAKIASVWRLLPEVDEVVTLRDKSIWTVANAIKVNGPFDVAILFPGSLRVALEVWLAGVPRRVGFRGHSRAVLLNQIVPDPLHVGPPAHQVEHYAQIAKDLGSPVRSRSISIESSSRATRRTRPKLGLCPGAEYGPAKRWLPERFAEAALAVSARYPVEWTLFGTARDSAVGGIIATALGEGCVNRIGQTTLEELIAELRECELLLTNDTGTMHLATLLGVPVVAVFGSTEPTLTGPLGANHTIIRHQVECSPCFLRECPIDFRCMKGVTSAEVAQAVLATLSRSLAAFIAA